jgi:hypothetical protein
MPLTNEEREFLDAYVYEATSGPPFGGPATKILAALGIWYSDVSWLLAAYQEELSAKGIPSTGVKNPTPPPSPWRDLEEVKRRCGVLKCELETSAIRCNRGPQVHATSRDGV